MVSLSLKASSLSRIRATGRDHVIPPSVERTTTTALDDPAANVPPLLATAETYTVPSGAKVTQGSVARKNSPPAQVVKAGEARLQVRPPSGLEAVTMPRAEPFDQRSCCHAATRWSAL